eukprot:tig00000350_g24313.t1
MAEADVHPEDVRDMAVYLGIDPSSEAHLLYIARLALRLPCPEGWTEHTDKEGRPFYRSADGAVSRSHPSDEMLKKLVRQERRRHIANMDGTSPEASWMAFRDADGMLYYYDFETRLTSSNAVRADLILPFAWSMELPALEPGGEHAQEPPAQLQKTRDADATARPPLTELTFYSWWLEGGGGMGGRGVGPHEQAQDTLAAQSVRHSLTLVFNISTGSASIFVDSDVHLALPGITDDRNRPITCWDINVGTRVNALGRWVVLKHASVETLEWLEAHRRRLCFARERLREILPKYSTKSRVGYPEMPLIPFQRQAATEILLVREFVVKGKASLRRLRQEVADMVKELAKHRPRVAERFAVVLDPDGHLERGGGALGDPAQPLFELTFVAR